MPNLRVKNWSSMQSYKDRRPPWIRLHKTILDDYEFHSMSVTARAVLPMLWLLASEDVDPVSGLLRDGYEKMAFRLRMTKKDLEGAIKECINSGFIEQLEQEVTEPLQIRNQTVTPETETEERQRHIEQTEAEGAVVTAIKPKRVIETRLEDWMEKEGYGDIPKAWGDYSYNELLMTVQEINKEWDKFRDHWKTKGGVRGKKADWPATWRNWCRQSIEYKNERRN